MNKTSNILTENDVNYAAKLARLSLTKKDIIVFQKQLSDIINLVNQLRKVETKDVIPTSQVTRLENILREDFIKPSLTQKEALANAPKKYNGYFVVEAIFE